MHSTALKTDNWWPQELQVSKYNYITEFSIWWAAQSRNSHPPTNARKSSPQLL